jgi:hypothetical protein
MADLTKLKELIEYSTLPNLNDRFYILIKT